MSVAEEIEQRDLETKAMGRRLIGLAEELAAMECEWLTTLWEFNLRGGWADDGEVSCTDWLVSRCGLSRVTAREKIRVAHELSRRPVVREAFATGALSYTKVRAIARLRGMNEETDRWLLKLAEKGTAADLEVAARHFEELNRQEEPVDSYLRRWDKATVRSSRTFDGMKVIEIVAPIEEGEEVMAHLRAAELDLVRTGAANLDTPSDTSGADRYTVHAVADIGVLTGAGEGRAELLEGTRVAPETIERWACDSAIVRHIVEGESEPLDIGRKTKVWTTAQRRAIIVRDNGQCRWPNCWRRTCDIHHVVWYAEGGITAVYNGCLLCPHHHTYVHEKHFKVTGEPNATLRFWRPDGELIGEA